MRPVYLLLLAGSALFLGKPEDFPDSQDYRDVPLDGMTRQLGSGSKVEGSPEPSHNFKTDAPAKTGEYRLNSRERALFLSSRPGTFKNSPARQGEPSVAGLSVRQVAWRTISVYGFPGDGSGPASGFICAVPYKGKKSKGRWEWKRGTKLRLTNGKRSVVVKVADVCNGRYWNRRIDLPKEPYLALGGPREWGLIHGVKVEVVE